MRGLRAHSGKGIAMRYHGGRHPKDDRDDRPGTNADGGSTFWLAFMIAVIVFGYTSCVDAFFR